MATRPPWTSSAPNTASRLAVASFTSRRPTFLAYPSGGPICQNARTHPLPQVILNANQDAHAAISDYASDNGISDPVWLNYKLINVQYQPFDISEVVSDTTSDLNKSTFYNNNEVIETDYTLVIFSGRSAIRARRPTCPRTSTTSIRAGRRSRTSSFRRQERALQDLQHGGMSGLSGVAAGQQGHGFQLHPVGWARAGARDPGCRPAGDHQPGALAAPLARD